jgi:glutamate decarboxylase
VDHHYRLELAALRNAIDRCHANGQLILAIVGLAGSTDCGSIDPLSDIADVAEESNTHFHVDAAWGGPLIFSDSYRSMLEGIERADSVTLDGHKQMYVPIGSSMLLLKSPQQANVIEKQAHYVLRQGSGDLGKRSVEGSRAGSALFLHAALSIIGSEGYGFLIEENIRKARFMAQLIRRSPEFELIAEPETNILLYRYLPRELRARSAKNGSLTDADNRRINDLNERLQKLQHEAGRTYVSRTTVEKCRCQQAVSLVALRAVIANPLTTEEDIKVVLQDQITIAATL